MMVMVTVARAVVVGLRLGCVVPMEIPFINLEDNHKNYGTLRSQRDIFSNPF